jgi:hypothetical protein
LKTPLEKAIEDIKFLRDKADHVFAAIAYGMAITIMELHLKEEKELLKNKQ